MILNIIFVKWSKKCQVISSNISIVSRRVIRVKKLILFALTLNVTKTRLSVLYVRRNIGVMPINLSRFTLMNCIGNIRVEITSINRTSMSWRDGSNCCCIIWRFVLKKYPRLLWKWRKIYCSHTTKSRIRYMRMYFWIKLGIKEEQICLILS